MENHIRIEETNVLQYEPLYFYKNNRRKQPSKKNHFPSINESLRKNQGC